MNFPDCAGWTPLHVAAQAKRPYICYMLLRRGADISMQTIRKTTAVDLSKDQRVFRVMRIASRTSEIEKGAQEFLDSLEDEEKQREKRAKSSSMDTKVSDIKEVLNQPKNVELIEQQQEQQSSVLPIKVLKKPSLQRSAAPKLHSSKEVADGPFSNPRLSGASHQQHP